MVLHTDVLQLSFENLAFFFVNNKYLSAKVSTLAAIKVLSEFSIGTYL